MRKAIARGKPWDRNVCVRSAWSVGLWESCSTRRLTFAELCLRENAFKASWLSAGNFVRMSALRFKGSDSGRSDTLCREIVFPTNPMTIFGNDLGKESDQFPEAMRDVQTWLNKTPEGRNEARKSQDRVRKQLSRLNESAEQRWARLEKTRERARRRRSQERSEKIEEHQRKTHFRVGRKVQDAARKSIVKVNETAEQRLKRLEKNRLYARKMRSQETPEQTEERRRKNRERVRIIRAKETQEKTEARKKREREARRDQRRLEKDVNEAPELMLGPFLGKELTQTETESLSQDVSDTRGSYFPEIALLSGPFVNGDVGQHNGCNVTDNRSKGTSSQFSRVSSSQSVDVVVSVQSEMGESYFHETSEESVMEQKVIATKTDRKRPTITREKCERLSRAIKKLEAIKKLDSGQSEGAGNATTSGGCDGRQACISLQNL